MILAGILTSLLLLHEPIQASDLYKSVLPSVVTLKVEKRNGDSITGSGFLAFQDGALVTAFHVVSDAKVVKAKFSDGEEFECSGLIDKDEKRDVAVIRVRTVDRPKLAIAEGIPEVGSKAYVVGSPRGLDFSITDGIISQIQTIDGFRQLQFSCPASPGNSGGPIINEKGQAIGVVSWQLKDSQNLNFAIPVTYVKGLDLTLPTTAWEQVKVSHTNGNSTSSLSPDTAIKITNLRIAASNYIWAVFDLERAVTRISPGRVVIPTSVFAAIDNLPRLASQLVDLPVPEDDIKASAKSAAESWITAAEGLNDMKNATVYAMSDGWTGLNNSLKNKGFSKVFSGEGKWEKSRKAILDALPADFVQKLPEDIRAGMFLAPDEYSKTYAAIKATGIVNDIRYLQNLVVAIVLTDSTGSKADIRPADTILKVDNKEFSSWKQLSAYLEERRGQKVQVRVKRLVGGEATLSLSIPPI